MAKIKKIKLPNDETLYELEGSITDISNTTSNIDSITTDYPDISASDKASTLFGKIKKFLSDLKSKVTSLSSDLANKQDESTAINTSNISYQSVKYANSAGSATDSTKVKKAGDTMTGRLTIKGTASSVPLVTRGIGGSDGNGNLGVLYLNYDSDYEVMFGKAAQANFNKNGTLTTNGIVSNNTINISGNYSYKLNNRVSIYDLGTTVFALCANGGATVRRYDNANNYAGISANAFTNVSSRLIKKNIKNISDDEAKKILDLRIVDFDYEEIVGGETGQIGLIAEETIDIFPYCVKVPDNYNEETTKQQLAEGKVLDLLELDYSKLVAPLIKMVQIQQSRIEELKAEVEKLRDAIES